MIDFTRKAKLGLQIPLCLLKLRSVALKDLETIASVFLPTKWLTGRPRLPMFGSIHLKIIRLSPRLDVSSPLLHIVKLP